MLEDLREGRNVVVLRTSPRFRLAGMRIGSALPPCRWPGSRWRALAVQHLVLARPPPGGPRRRDHDCPIEAENSREAASWPRAGPQGMKFVPTVELLPGRYALKGEELFERCCSRASCRPLEAYGFGDAVRVSVGTAT